MSVQGGDTNEAPAIGRCFVTTKLYFMSKILIFRVILFG